MPKLSRRSQRPQSSPVVARRNAQPEYEQQACHLSASGRRALGELSSNQEIGTYGNFIKDSVAYIGQGVGDIHERFCKQRERLEGIQRRRQEKNKEKTEEEERLEAHLVEFGQAIDAVTRQSEKSIRDLVDYRVELEDETVVVRDLYTAATTDQHEVVTRRRAAEAEEELGQREGEEDSKAAVPSESTLDAFRAKKRQKHGEFQQMTMHQRYAVDNDYAAFKRLWHDAAQGEEGPPLPEASRWFRSDGQPVMSSATTGTGFEETVADDEDDDIAVAREIRSINCPLTLVPMVEPYSNHKCKHTFEKSAIRDYLASARRGSKECPQSGCSQVRCVPCLFFGLFLPVFVTSSIYSSVTAAN